MTNPHSRAEKIAIKIITRYKEIGVIEEQLLEGIIRGLELLPCSLETLSDSQIVDIVGRLAAIHFQASRYAQLKYDITEPSVAKLTKFVINSVDQEQ